MDLLLLLRVGCFGIVSMTNAKDGKTMAMQVRFYTVDGTAGCTSGSKKNQQGTNSHPCFYLFNIANFLVH